MRWDAARTASRRPLPKPRKLHGPVGPDIVASETDRAVLVNGVGMEVNDAFSLGVDIPALGISAYGPGGPEFGKRGDGRSACQGCGYQLCSCVNSVARGPAWDSYSIADAIDRLPRAGCESCARTDGAHATDCMKLHEAVAANFADIVDERMRRREAAVQSQLRPCIVCSVPHNGSGAACLTCVQRADAEAKPFRDAMNEKIKTLAQHWSAPLIYRAPVGDLKVVVSPYARAPMFVQRRHRPQDGCPCIDCRNDRGQQASRPVLLATILPPADKLIE